MLFSSLFSCHSCTCNRRHSSKAMEGEIGEVGEDCFLLHVMPWPLRAAVQRKGMMAFLGQVLKRGIEAQGDSGLEAPLTDHTDLKSLTHSVTEFLIAAINPLAQEAMEEMSPYERTDVMRWLSNPKTIAEAMAEMFEDVLTNKEAAAEATQKAFALVHEFPEIAQILSAQDEEVVEQISNHPEQILNELQALRNGNMQPTISAAERRARERHAKQVAGSAALTAERARLPPAPEASSTSTAAAFSTSAAASTSASASASTSATVVPAASSAAATSLVGAHSSGAASSSGAFFTAAVKTPTSALAFFGKPAESSKAAASSRKALAAGKQPAGRGPGVTARAPSRKSSQVRCSSRLREQLHSDPLGVLDDDSLAGALVRLGAPDLRSLHRVSRAWRAQVERHLRSREWRDAHGCVYASSLLKVLTESGVARLDLGPAGFRLPPALRQHQCHQCVVFRRLDGPSVGPISTSHAVGIFDERALRSEDPPAASYDGGPTSFDRLDLTIQGFVPQVIGCEDACTQVRLRPLRPPPHAVSGGKARAGGKGPLSADAPGHMDEPLCYDQVFCVEDRTGRYRLRLPPVTNGRMLSESWSARLRLQCVDDDASKAAEADRGSESESDDE